MSEFSVVGVCRLRGKTVYTVVTEVGGHKIIVAYVTVRSGSGSREYTWVAGRADVDQGRVDQAVRDYQAARH